MRDPLKPAVLIYADPLLSPTMTFVLAQGEALKSFVPYFVGPRGIGPRGLRMPADRTIAINQIPGLLGKFREAPFRRFGFAPVFFRKLRNLYPVLIHAHFGPAGLPALRISEWLRIPLITTFHGFDATAINAYSTDPRYGNLDYLRRKNELMKKCHLFIAVSNFIRGRLLAQGFPESKIRVHYTGVDTKVFRADRSVTREPIVLFVGTLHEGKGCEYVIRAMAKLQFKLPESRLVVIGNGPLRTSLEDLAKRELREYKFLGIQPPDVVKQWMSRAKVFCTPSITARTGWTEAFGMVFAEAQAMGLPVVSFSSGGIPEVVLHGETGFLAKEKDWESLAEYIAILLHDEERWHAMSADGVRRVRELFNLSIQTKELEALYQELIENVTSRHDAQANAYR